MDLLYTKYSKELRFKVLIGLSFLLVLICAITFLVNYSRQGFNLYATIELSLVFMYLTCLYSLLKQGISSWNKAFVIYSYIVVILFMTTESKLNAGILNWVFTIPLMLYILYSKRHAFISCFLVMIYQVANVYSSADYGQAYSFYGVPNFFLAYCLIWLLSDLYITQNRLIRQKIMVHATQDSLTGAYNRLSLQQHIESYHHQTPLSLCLLDIDYFKKINDKYGHGIGDQVLSRLVNIISQHTSVEQVYRIGGEEFVLLFKDDLAIATKKSEEILTIINSSDYQDIHPELSLGFSAGVAKLSHEDDLSDVLRRADDYLYQAKQSGRNKVMSDLSQL